MNHIFVLTAHDSTTNSFITTSYYSERNTAYGSFESLQKYIVQKYSLNEQDISKWTYSDGGDNRTNLIGERFNISLTRCTISNDISTWI